MSKPSLAPFIRARPWLRRWMQPLANWYVDSCGYRQVGLFSDDLIPEESDTVQKALKRLPPKDAYDRVFRLRRAFQLSLSHNVLPKSDWTTSEQDAPYLSNIIEDIEREERERRELDAMVPTKK